METKYRLRRNDKRNIVIERKRKPKPSEQGDGEYWNTIFYCGNNAKSVARGLLEVALTDYSPGDESLLNAVKTLELELVSGLERIEKLAKEIIDG